MHTKVDVRTNRLDNNPPTPPALNKVKIASTTERNDQITSIKKHERSTHTFLKTEADSQDPPAIPHHAAKKRKNKATE